MLDKEKIYNVCHKRGIPSNYYDKNPERKSGCYKKNITNRKKWTNEEVNILIDNYDIMPVSEILKLIPYRTADSIVQKARTLNLFSYVRMQQLYSNDDKNFIINNWMYLSDDEMAQTLNRTKRSIKAMRCMLGCYRQDVEYTKYQNLIKFLRGKLHQWKIDSMEQCGYKCIITGDKNFDIHHIVSFNIIVDQFIKDYNIDPEIDVNNKNDPQVLKLINDFINEHNKYPLGICLREDIHALYHSMYGDKNDEKQFNLFVQKIKNGEISY